MKIREKKLNGSASLLEMKETYPEPKMTKNELSNIIVNTCLRIHVELGPGLFESVYEEILTYELVQKAYKFHVSSPFQ